MKRWLVGSLALNVLLVGIGAGFFVGGVLRPEPLRPPMPPGPGVQRDLAAAVETGLSGASRDAAREIVRRNLPPPPPMPMPRFEDMLARFVAGDVPKTPDFLDPAMEARRKRDIESLRKTFAELADVLETPERETLAAALAARVAQVRACIDSPR